jgi:hypothetical protein
MNEVPTDVLHSFLESRISRPQRQKGLEKEERFQSYNELTKQPKKRTKPPSNRDDEDEEDEENDEEEEDDDENIFEKSKSEIVDSSFQHKYALLSHLTYLNNTEARKKLQKLDELKGWQINTDLSTREEKVFVNENKGQVVIGFRGSRNIKDWTTSDVHIAVGKVGNDDRFQKSLRVYKKVKNKYKNKEISLTGHSLGGAVAFYVGRQTGSRSVNFNPGLSPLKHFSEGNFEGKHYVFRTISDPVSLGYYRFKDVSNVKILNLNPKEGMGKIQDTHALEQFMPDGKIRLTNQKTYDMLHKSMYKPLHKLLKDAEENTWFFDSFFENVDEGYNKLTHFATSALIKRKNNSPDWIDDVFGGVYFGGQVLEILGNQMDLAADIVTPFTPMVGSNYDFIGEVVAQVGRDLELLGREEEATWYQKKYKNTIGKARQFLYPGIDSPWLKDQIDHAVENRKWFEQTYYGKYASWIQDTYDSVWELEYLY